MAGAGHPHHLIERGYDPRGFTLVAMGGAGPMHAGADRERARHPRGALLVPPWPGNSARSAFSPATFAHHFVRTALWHLADLDVDAALHIYAEMEASGASFLRGEGLR